MKLSGCTEVSFKMSTHVVSPNPHSEHRENLASQVAGKQPSGFRGRGVESAQTFKLQIFQVVFGECLSRTVDSRHYQRQIRLLGKCGHEKLLGHFGQRPRGAHRVLPVSLPAWHAGYFDDRR